LEVKDIQEKIGSWNDAGGGGYSSFLSLKCLSLSRQKQSIVIGGLKHEEASALQ